MSNAEKLKDNPLFEGVGHKRQRLLAFVEEQHYAQVSETLVGEAGTCDKLETLDLAKVGRRTKHVDVEQLRDIIVTRKGVLFLERCADRCGLLLDEGALIGHGLWDTNNEREIEIEGAILTLQARIPLMRASGQ